MVKKNELLKALNEGLLMEEEMTHKLSEFFESFDWKNEVEEKDARFIEDGLKLLKNDTDKHTVLIKEMVWYIENSGLEEF
jgi:hypothetical protein